ncbi:glycoside hydrolase family 28 protein [Thozetella sp. PMI_491]|nr:glycoside hydrolase family 28 protein [Thozetella sp. PMI_491]
MMIEASSRSVPRTSFRSFSSMPKMKQQLVLILSAVALATAQLTGRVGPSTTRAAKAAKKVCSILSYGGVASGTTDNSAAVLKAWDACKTGGQVVVPSGSYGLNKWVSLSGGAGVSFNLEGIFLRMSNGTANGSIIAVQDTDDFEFYSGNSKGAIQGYGYEFHKENKYGPSLIKFTNVTNFSIHDMALVDSPASHLTIDTSANGEVYNMIIYGGDRGGLDGIDVSSTNTWIHDIEVSNGGDCVAVKSPSKAVQIESIFCNRSGGCTIGPLGIDISVRDILYQYVYSQSCDHMMMLKSNGGSGPVRHAGFYNFTGHANNYTLNLDGFWVGKEVDPGDGVEYDEVTIAGWTGTCKDGNKYPPLMLQCPAKWSCGGVEVDDFNVWTETGTSELFKCQNAYGYGACLNPYAGNGAYKTTMTVQSMATEKYSIKTMPTEATKGLGITTSIEIPAVPTTFYPGLKPTSTLLGKP